ncbi:Hexose carrier protein [Mycena sanguinolenta]|uniref:Hexose carrier protein n=1 Tax=Mycena sanguinolenta TaxID=230812 RepID=A0A8H6XTY3_9AGAR|nr:Hexose carrier protein [Mycena sanguinolenta]
MSLSDSPFANRLNTNYVPSSSEILLIRSLLVDPLEEIARIDAQIEEMELALAKLKEKRALLVGPIDAHRALISPIRLIPQDILLEIFLACLPSEHNALIDPAEAPFLLGRICRHWRSVVYSAPMLWSSLHIPTPDYLNTPPSILLGLERSVAAWLGRSASCPLSVSLCDSANRVDFNRHLEKHPLALQIPAVSGRLRSLVLAGDVELLRPILQLGPTDLPQLETIRMQTPPNQTPSTTILEVPTLEDVALCITVPTDPLSLPLPWSNLRRLRLEFYLWRTAHGNEGGLDFDGALDVLRRCPRLESCEIRVNRFSARYSGSGLGHDSSSIILPHLHTLILSGFEFQLQRWIPDLVVPNLRSLQIGNLNTSPSRSNRARLSVDLDLTRFTTTSLREFLESFPMISHLQLMATHHPTPASSEVDEFIALICPPHYPCPMLTDIKIVAPPFARVSDAQVLALIKARMSMPNPLRRFQARFNRPMELDVMPELQSFISDGLQVNLEYPPAAARFLGPGGAGRTSSIVADLTSRDPGY